MCCNRDHPDLASRDFTYRFGIIRIWLDVTRSAVAVTESSVSLMSSVFASQSFTSTEYNGSVAVETASTGGTTQFVRNLRPTECLLVRESQFICRSCV